MMKNVPELLAPAGNFSSLKVAIQSGADSVFFGIGDFNMRASASVNFQESDLPKIVSMCKSAGVKSYLTLNTLMYNSDLGMMRKCVDLVKQSGVDAIIAADIATILYAREQGVNVHLSTQMSVSNIEGVRFYAQFCDAIVLARELTLEQVKEIIKQIESENIVGPNGDLVKIEVFAHGALCVSVSGRCGMSLYHQNRSANKGQCSQICRRPYKVTDIANGKEMIVDNNYIMSSADLCTIGFLPELVAAGVSILKFEGRGRPPEYVETVVSTYKEAIEAIKSGGFNSDKVKVWQEKLGTVFNRGLSDGYYMGRKLNEWAGRDGSQATQIKVQIGVVEKYYPKIKVAQFTLTAKENLVKNNELLFIGAKTGLVRHVITNLVIDNKEVNQAQQGDVITVMVEQKLKAGDVVYLVKSIAKT